MRQANGYNTAHHDGCAYFVEAVALALAQGLLRGRPVAFGKQKPTHVGQHQKEQGRTDVMKDPLPVERENTDHRCLAGNSRKLRGEEGNAQAKQPGPVGGIAVQPAVAFVGKQEQGHRTERAHKQLAHVGIIIMTDGRLQHATVAQQPVAEREREGQQHAQPANGLACGAEGDDLGRGAALGGKGGVVGFEGHGDEDNALKSKV